MLLAERGGEHTTVQLGLADDAEGRARVGRLERKVLEGVGHTLSRLEAGAGTRSNSERNDRRSLVLSSEGKRTRAATGTEAGLEVENVRDARSWAGTERSTLVEDLGTDMELADVFGSDARLGEW